MVELVWDVCEDPYKCFAISIQASTAKRVNPHLQLQDKPIPPVEKGSIKFLLGLVSVPSTTSQHRQQLEEKLGRLLKRVDDTSVTRKQKLLLYNS